MRNSVLSIVALLVMVMVVLTAVMGMMGGSKAEPAPQFTPPPQPVVVTQPVVVAPPVAAPVVEDYPLSQIFRVGLDGQDLADLRNLKMWKYAFELPQGPYTAFVWVEYWTRNAAEPTYREMFSASDVWREGELVVKLPTADDPGMLVRIGRAQARADAADPVDIPRASRLELLDILPVAAGQDIPLATFTYNESGSAAGGLSNVHSNHDVTVYLKARFVRGLYASFQSATPDEMLLPWVY
jgi:hypothetical protein